MKMVRILVALVTVAIVVAGGCAIFCKVSYLDERTTTGEAHGFVVGMTKREAYARAAEVFRGQEVFVLHPLNHQNFGPHLRFLFDEDDYSVLSERDDWKIFLDDGYFDFIVLRFNSGRLIELYRHRNRCEAP